MKSIPYSELNKKQLAQVGYLFADEHFNTDPNTYLYEVDGNGDVKGRVSTEETPANSKRAQIRPQINITAIEEVNVTEEMIQRALMNMDAFAEIVARKIYQQQRNQK